MEGELKAGRLYVARRDGLCRLQLAQMELLGDALRIRTFVDLFLDAD